MRPLIIETVAASARRAAPAEVCGLIATAESADDRCPLRLLASAVPVPVANADPRPGCFALDALAHIAAAARLRGSGGRVVGYYHSHPQNGVVAPSLADGSSELWPTAPPALRLIVARNGAWALYRVTAAGWQREAGQ